MCFQGIIFEPHETDKLCGSHQVIWKLVYSKHFILATTYLVQTYKIRTVCMHFRLKPLILLTTCL